jgi:hypothetical protein
MRVLITHACMAACVLGDGHFIWVEKEPDFGRFSNNLATWKNL